MDNNKNSEAHIHFVFPWNCIDTSTQGALPIFEIYDHNAYHLLFHTYISNSVLLQLVGHIIAMLAFLNQLQSFVRTTNSSQNPLILDGGRASLEFFRLGSTPNFMRATIPKRLPCEMPIKTDADVDSLNFPPQKSSTIIPPLHWHANQDETFTVISGSMLAHISSTSKLVGAGEHIFIRRGYYHTFSNPSASEDLVMDVKLSPDNRLRDERFFRNAYGYLNDVTRTGKVPSPFQALLFLWSADVKPTLPGPTVIMKPLARVLGWIGGVVVGKWVLGYREWYAEYTPEELRDVNKSV
jgi:mannose-6-phosphate isomerase-like protein (cupin superfamily)